MTDIEVKIRDFLPDLSHAERVAAQFLLDNFDRFLNFTSQELSQKSLASKATWTRFSKTVGYAGLKDLRRAVVISMQTNINERPTTGSDAWLVDVKSEAGISTIASKIADTSIKAILDTVGAMDEAQYEASAKHINNARSIRIYGMGASSVVATDLSQKLIRIGKNVMFCQDFHDSVLSASSIQAGDVAIFISYSGKTNEILRLMNIVRKTGAVVIVITKYGLNRMIDLADYKLIVSTPEAEKRVGAMSSRIAQLTVVDILYNLVLKSDSNGTEHKLKKTYEISLDFKEDK